MSVKKKRKKIITHNPSSRIESAHFIDTFPSMWFSMNLYHRRPLCLTQMLILLQPVNSKAHESIFQNDTFSSVQFSRVRLFATP